MGVLRARLSGVGGDDLMGQRIVRMSGQFFADMFGTGKRSYEVVENPIPIDAKIVNARVAFPYLAGTGDLEVLLESAEWPDTPEGKPIEEVMPTMRRIDG
jgi:hypothetical protein